MIQNTNVEAKEFNFALILPIETLLNYFKYTIIEYKFSAKYNELNTRTLCTSILDKIQYELQYSVFLDSMRMDLTTKNLCTDDHIKDFLYSIVSPDKLSSLNKWIHSDITSGENFIKGRNKYTVIIHPFPSTSNLENIALRLQAFHNEHSKKSKCALNLNEYFQILKINPLALFDGELEYDEHYLTIIALIDILWSQIYYSNSTRLYKHVNGINEEIIKEYLFSSLTLREIELLKVYLSGNKLFSTVCNQYYDLITSIYIADYY
jgi:hypothetical protein